MTQEDAKRWFRAVVEDLSLELGDDLPKALDLAAGFQADSDPVVRSIGADLGKEIKDELRRRRLARIADAMEERRVEMNGSTPPGIPERYWEWVRRLEKSLERLEGGGLSPDSAVDVARGIEIDLDLIRRQSKNRRRDSGHRAGEPDPKIRGWLKRSLASLRMRYARARS